MTRIFKNFKCHEDDNNFKSNYCFYSRKRCKIDDEEDDVIVIEQEPEKPDGSKIWCCQLCPIFMSSANEMQVLVPCGHTLCFDCSTHLKYCPIEECSRKVNKILMPKIQQTDEENVDSQQPEVCYFKSLLHY